MIYSSIKLGQHNNKMCNCIDSTMIDIIKKLTAKKTIIQTLFSLDSFFDCLADSTLPVCILL